jgi:uncharacterized protein YndB with AHSA1/START domain
MKEIDSIRLGTDIAAPARECFERFAGSIGRWWPIAYTWGETDFATATIERRAGGRWYETLQDGTEREWGEVRAFEQGARLVLSFNISPDRSPEPPERQSEVEVRFLPRGDETRVELEHRDLARHGAKADRLREAMASPQGWPLILASFAREMRYTARPATAPGTATP